MTVEQIKKRILRDGLEVGDFCRIVSRTDEIFFGRIVYENEFWREIQINENFKVCSFYNHKFHREIE